MIVQDVVSATQQDLQNMVGMNHPAIMDYVGRIQLWILKRSRFNFLLSAPLQFITEKGQTDYWVGPVGTGPLNVVDTGLNLSDVEFIKPGSIMDLSNMKNLGRVAERPNVNRLQYPDAAQRLGKPAVWRQDTGTSNIVNIYPAPDNQNGYSPVPEAPYVSTVTSGALAARTYSVRITLVDSLGGESIAPNQAFVYIPAGSVAVVHPPNPTIINGASGIKYDRYKVYAVQTTNTGGGGEVFQAGPLAITGTWQEPNTGLIGGATVPSSSSLAQLGGYIIQFRYFKQRQTGANLTLSTTLQVPDEYFDTMVAGVNWLGFNLRSEVPYCAQQSLVWKANFEELLTAMIRDKYQFPRGQDYLSPDSASIQVIQPGVETIELANLLNI